MSTDGLLLLLTLSYVAKATRQLQVFSERKRSGCRYVSTALSHKIHLLAQSLFRTSFCLGIIDIVSVRSILKDLLHSNV